MAAIALPKLKLPQVKLPAFDLRAIGKSPVVGLGAAAVVFAATIFALVRLLGPLGPQDTLRLPLEAAYRAAPDGWRDDAV